MSETIALQCLAKLVYLTMISVFKVQIRGLNEGDVVKEIQVWIRKGEIGRKQNPYFRTSLCIYQGD